MPFKPNSEAGQAKLQPTARGLGPRLREMFASMAQGPMPEHLVDLVDQLERAYETRQTCSGVGEPRTLVPEAY
jgi:hypothetical protein